VMRDYPQQVILEGQLFLMEKILKDDFFSVNVLYRSTTTALRYVLKLSDFRFIFGALLRPMASLMSWREYWIYQKVADLEGVPRLGPRFGNRGYFHAFAEGKTLFEVNDPAEIPPEFFKQLHAILNQVHARRIAYIDLNKLGNVILGNDGLPYLIDYQICLPFPTHGWLANVLNPVFEQLAHEDLYHLYKHKRRFQPELMTEDEKAMATKSPLNWWYDRNIGTPYRKLKRRIYPHGSNETLWFKWDKQATHAEQMP
jgi:hypothetical protein